MVIFLGHDIALKLNTMSCIMTKCTAKIYYFVAPALFTKVSCVAFKCFSSTNHDSIYIVNNYLLLFPKFQCYNSLDYSQRRLFYGCYCSGVMYYVDVYTDIG